MKYIALLLSLIVPSSALVVLAQQREPTPIINIHVSRSVTSVTYLANSGFTPIGLQGTELLPRAKGKALVASKQGVTNIEAEFSKLEPATNFGAAYLTYVLWAISPEGRANNLGEVLLKGNKGKLRTATRLSSFGMILTAEPYFAVTFPSEIVVMENVILPRTRGKIAVIDAKYELLQRGSYEAEELEPVRIEPHVPLELYQARLAAHIARRHQADRYAAASWEKMRSALQNAEDYQRQKGNHRKSVVMSAREAVQMAEDARVISVKRIEEARLADERRLARERQTKTKAETETEARRRANAEARQREEEEARRRAEAARSAAEKREIEAALASARAAKARAEAEAGRLAAESQVQKAKAQEQQAKTEAERARLALDKAERDRQQLRAQLLKQFNRILATRDTDRGLVVTMADILFDTGKFSLRPAAREKLAKLSGILLAHPGLKLEVEGHADNVGSQEYNHRLSDKRAESVRSYLIEQGLSGAIVTAKGFGEMTPVADNTTPQGRQQNRRVELIVSGEVIGAKIGK